MKLKRYRILCLNIFFFFIFLVGAFTFLEFTTRILDRKIKKSVYDIFRSPVPYVGFSGRPHIGDHNQLGYRGQLLKETEATDIVILGGSTVYNGTPPLPALIEEELNNEYPTQKFNVYNYGIPSTKSSGELSRLVHQIIQHQPEVVIAYHGANDIGLFGGDPRVGHPFDFYIIEKNPLALSSPKKMGILHFLITRSHFIRYYFPNFIHKEILGLRAMKKKEGAYTADRAQRAVKLLEENINKMNSISKGQNIIFHSVIQPIKNLKEKQDNGLWNGVPLLRILGSKKIEFITSLIDSLQSRQECFIDTVHIKQDCKKIIAQKLAHIIKKILNNNID